MKRTLALLLASVLTCSVLLTSLPALSNTVSAATNPVAGAVKNEILYEWTLKGELEKATINTASTGAVDFTNSLFTIECTDNDGSNFKPMKNGSSAFTSESGSFSIIKATDPNGQGAWKNGVVVNSDGSIKTGSEYPTKKIRFVFTAPVEGLYTLVPEEIAGKGVSAYAYAYDNHALIYTDSEMLSEGDILVNPSKYADNFKIDCETCIELKEGAKLYIEFDPTKAESYIRAEKKPGFVLNGMGVVANFNIILNSYSTKSTVYNKSYDIGTYIKDSIPVSYEKQVLDENGEPELDKNKQPKTETITYPTDGTANTYHDGFVNEGTYFVQMKNPWDQTKWGKASRFQVYGSESVAFGYGNPAGKYHLSVTKDNKVTMSTWSSVLDWRIGFTAPKDDIYYIDLSAITATELTDERNVFRIYTSNALDSDGNLKSDADAFAVYDFYKDRTNVEYPCADGLLKISLKKGEILYFESDVTGGKAYQATLLGVEFSLSIKTGLSERTNTILDGLELTYGKDKVTSYHFTDNTKANEMSLTLTKETTKANVGTNVRWYSTNPKVATVDQNGKVTSVKGANGFAYMVAYNDFTSDTFLVKVGTIKAVTGVAIGANSITMDKYDTNKLTYTTTPSDAHKMNIKWTSSNENVVEVLEDGSLKATGIGSAVVTLTIDGKSDTCPVTVNEHYCSTSNASWKTHTAATCTEDGLDQLLCNKCFEVLDEMVTPAVGHVCKDEWITYSTYDKTGSCHRVCRVCGYDAVEVMPVGTVDTATLLTSPTKVSYGTDDKFNTSGMSIEVTYTNYDFTTTVTDFSNVKFNYDFSVEGNVNVTFTLAGVNFSIPVIVSDGPIKYGDVDNDGDIDVTDAETLMKYFSGYDVDIRSINSDVQKDGDVDVADAVMIYQYLAGQITAF